SRALGTPRVLSSLFNCPASAEPLSSTTICALPYPTTELQTITLNVQKRRLPSQLRKLLILEIMLLPTQRTRESARKTRANRPVSPSRPLFAQQHHHVDNVQQQKCYPLPPLEQVTPAHEDRQEQRQACPNRHEKIKIVGWDQRERPNEGT